MTRDLDPATTGYASEAQRFHDPLPPICAHCGHRPHGSDCHGLLWDLKTPCPCETFEDHRTLRP